MLKKVYLLLSTIRHLKPSQVKYQLLYRLAKPKAIQAYYDGFDQKEIDGLKFRKIPPVYSSYESGNGFNFLNQSIVFGDEIDWNFQGNGKLWNYNLQYGNYLLHDDVSFEKGSELLQSLYSSIKNGQLPLEPYPASLRVINVIRFYTKHQQSNPEIFKNAYAEVNFLSKRPEYHLLGNHLLENAFALLMGGAFFSKKGWIQQGIKILQAELEEQILSDGAHFELSPMYHQIIFFRLLELIDWYSSFNQKNEAFEQFLRSKASMMYSWLEEITFVNGDIPHFNDSAIGIAYSTKWLLEYAAILDIGALKNVKLSESGYRAFKNGNYECIVDAAAIGPAYQPGHGHADALSFILYKNGKPLFVEKGTSTYQIGERRSAERSTSAHNTVVVENQNQSEVWGGFRVGRRANVTLIKDEAHLLSVLHDGYKKSGVVHHREFQFLSEQILINDRLEGWVNQHSVAFFHIHPDVKVELNEKQVILKGHGSVEFTGADEVIIDTYEMAEGYNNYLLGTRIIVKFGANLKTNIHLSIT